MWRRIAIVLAAASAAAPAAAQSITRPELFAGYALLNDPKTETEFRLGWMIGGAIPLTGWLFAVAEAGGNYARVPGFGSDTELRVHAGMGGVRASARLGPLV